ncbi:MAG TPA: Ig-like domain-containing protein [Chloroflexota bacterium]|nr:Ig-like domain-containing protein [Chloroflexota bacterium]
MALRRPGMVRQPTIGFILVVVLALPFLGDLFGVRDRALASFFDPQSGPLRITSPTDSAVVGDGDLVLVEGTAVDPNDGDPDPVEVSIDGSNDWKPADLDATEPGRWRYLWSDPSPGFHRILARSLNDAHAPVVEQSIIVQVAETWSTPFIIDNPYANAGSFRKGQLHMHTTNSFDGWNSLPPAQDALEYKRHGYQFVVLTDHDVVSNPTEVNDGTFVAIPGFESTSEKGHITASFTTTTVPNDLPPQDRIDAIDGNGGFAILAHPDWQVGWKGIDFQNLHGYLGFEIFNAVATTTAERQARNTQLWQDALNAKGWASRIWAVAVDDSHDPSMIDKGWVMVKSPQLTEASIKRSIEKGALYASNGPSFSVLGVLKDAITAVSPEASVIRFIDQDGNVVSEGPPSWAAYRPNGKERWIRVEATMADGRTAWSQPFWLIPNMPKVSYIPTWGGTMALVGQTVPGARVHISDHGNYLGSVVANDDGQFMYRSPALSPSTHDFWVLATAPWPDQVEGPPTLLAYSP